MGSYAFTDLGAVENPGQMTATPATISAAGIDRRAVPIATVSVPTTGAIRSGMSSPCF
jgi:hypothetical protein